MEPFGKFELLAPLAYGGMAELFIARQRGLANVERLVVVKRILPHLAGQTQFINMFLEEARIAALLEHPNIVPIYDLGHVEGSYFIAMPYIAGLTARSLLEETRKRGTLVPVEVACSAMLQVLAGLDYAHRKTRLDGTPLHIVHRDVSPSNVMLDEQGRVMLLDFGIAKATDKMQRETETGSIKGKLTYMSPEQCRADPLDRRSDLFSLGIVFHEMVTSERLFKRRTDMLVYRAIVEDPIPDPREVRPELPEPVAAVIRQALEREPDDRFDSAAEMSAALTRAMRSVSLPDGGPALIADYLLQHFSESLRKQREKLLDARTSGVPEVTEEDPTLTTAPGSLSGAPDEMMTGRGRPTAPGRRIPLLPLLAAGVLLLAAAGIVGYLLFGEATLSGPPLHLGVVPYLPPRVLRQEMEPLARYLGQRLGRPVKLVVPESYDATVKQLLEGQLELADLPAYPYLRARRQNADVKLLAMVVTAGAATYEGYLVVRRTSKEIERIDDLGGKRICYVDRSSTSGYLVPRVMVRRAGHDPDKLFASAQFSGNHYAALRDLLAERCDVAAVYSGAYLSATAKGIPVGRTRILAVSGGLPDDAICAAPGLDADVAAAVQRALLDLNLERELGRKTLGQSVPISGFTPPRLEDFVDLARELKD